MLKAFAAQPVGLTICQLIVPAIMCVFAYI